MVRPLALVRPPGPRLADGIVTHIDRVPVDDELARRQWRAYVDVLHEGGWSPVEVSGAAECPDAVFVEDTVVVHGTTAVVTRPGADARRAEVAEVEKVLQELGFSTNRITEPATLEGGDVLKVGDTFYVGRSGRTNSEGIRQLRRIFAPHGITVVAVPVSKVLHLKSAVTALPDGTIVGYEPLVDMPSLFPRFLPVPEESGSQVVLLDDERLLMAADAPRSAELFVDLGYEPVPVDVSELQKLEGSVTCLSVRLRSVSRA